jgi:hypothetical protein
MPKTVLKIENAHIGFSLTDPAVTVDLAVIADYSDFSCQVTSAELTASPNISSETIPATGCEAAETVPIVGTTSYSLVLGYLQDANVAAGLSRFLYENDADLVYFMMGMDGDDPPKAIGQVRATSGTIGGAMRTTLQASVTLPCESKPDIEFGDSTTSAVVTG